MGCGAGREGRGPSRTALGWHRLPPGPWAAYQRLCAWVPSSFGSSCFRTPLSAPVFPSASIPLLLFATLRPVQLASIAPPPLPPKVLTSLLSD